MIGAPEEDELARGTVPLLITEIPQPPDVPHPPQHCEVVVG